MLGNVAGAKADTNGPKPGGPRNTVSRENYLSSADGLPSWRSPTVSTASEMVPAGAVRDPLMPDVPSRGPRASRAGRQANSWPLFPSESASSRASDPSTSEPDGPRVEIDASLVDVPARRPPSPSFHLGIVGPPLPEAVGGRREPADDPRNFPKGHRDGRLVRWDARKMRWEPVVFAHHSIVAPSRSTQRGAPCHARGSGVWGCSAPVFGGARSGRFAAPMRR
jgi:hypothetical protein